MDKIFLNLYNFIIFLSLLLTGCNRYSIETNYDEFKKVQVCSLKNNLLLLEIGYFSGTRRLELNLDKVNHKSVLALFALSGINKNSFFKPESSIIFTLINEGNHQEKMELTPIAFPQNKSSQEPNYIFLNSIGYVGTLNYTEKTTSLILTQMTKEQIIKISKAAKVFFTFETMEGPLRGELDKYDLQPFQEFVQFCMLNEPNACRIQNSK